MRDSVT